MCVNNTPISKILEDISISAVNAEGLLLALEKIASEDLNFIKLDKDVKVFWSLTNSLKHEIHKIAEASNELETREMRRVSGGVK